MSDGSLTSASARPSYDAGNMFLSPLLCRVDALCFGNKDYAEFLTRSVILMPCACVGMWARQNAQSGNPAMRKLAAQKRVEGSQAMLDQAKQDLERAAERAKMPTHDQAAGTRVISHTQRRLSALTKLAGAAQQALHGFH